MAVNRNQALAGYRAAGPYLMNRMLIQEVANMVRNGTRGPGRRIAAFAVLLEKRVGNLGDLQQAHERVATLTRAALVKSYGDTVEAWKRVPSYRVGSRYAGGKLGQALSDDRMAVATPQGIKYIYTPLLRSKAKQWMRLNWGAGPQAQAPNAQFLVQWPGAATQVVARMGSQGQPRPAFGVPRGVWVGSPEGGGGGFRSSSQQLFVLPSRTTEHGQFQREPTLAKGIYGAHYIDAGYEVMARELPKAWDRLLDKWLGESTRAAAQAQGVLAGEQPNL